MKEFAPTGSKFFHFRIDPFSEGVRCAGNKQEVTIVVSLVKMAESLPSVSSPLNSLYSSTARVLIILNLSNPGNAGGTFSRR